MIFYVCRISSLGDPPMIRAVTYDLWFTLISSPRELDQWWNETRIERLTTLLNYDGFKINREQVAGYWMTEQAKLFQETREKGLIDIPSEGHVTHFFQTLQVPEALRSGIFSQTLEIFTRTMLERPPPLEPSIKDVFTSLRDRGIKIGLISNTGITPGSSFREMFQEWKILDYFEPDALIFSDEVELLKPNPKIFQIAADRLGIPLNELAHVGDNPLDDVKGVQDAGGHGILYTGLYHLFHHGEAERHWQRVRTLDKPPKMILGKHTDILDLWQK